MQFDVGESATRSSSDTKVSACGGLSVACCCASLTHHTAVKCTTLVVNGTKVGSIPAAEALVETPTTAPNVSGRGSARTGVVTSVSGLPSKKRTWRVMNESGAGAFAAGDAAGWCAAAACCCC